MSEILLAEAFAMDATNTAVLYEKYRALRLQELSLLDTEAEERFDRITRLARETFDTQIALVSLIDSDRQWFKSKQGTDVVSTPRSFSICDHAIRQDDVFVIENALEDPRFAKNPLVVGSPGIRFYAGAPIREPGGFKIGTLCIIDEKPRKLTAEEMSYLRDLATLTEAEIGRDLFDLAEEELLEQGALSRSLRICQQQLLPNPSDFSQSWIILDQLVELTGSTGGFVLDASKMGVGESTPVVSVRVPPGVDGQLPLWDTLQRGIVDPRQLEALINREYCANAVGYPLITDNILRGFVVLLGRGSAYPGSFHFELSPLLQLATIGLERQRLILPKPRKSERPQKYWNGAKDRSCMDRRELHRFVSRELQRAHLRGGSLSVCMLDVDDFRRVNEQLGQGMGDRVLGQIDARLRRLLGQGDVLLAVGGDEFVLLLRDVSSNASYARVLEVFRQPFQCGSENVELSGSMGVSVYPLDPSDSETILRHADQAMCLAKEEGRGRCRLFDIEKFRAKEERVALARELEQGLEKGEFELFLQPKICLTTQRILGYEGLIRWHHSVRGLLTPDHFLPAIESSSLEGQLGRFVLRAGMEILASFRKRGLDCGLSVNLTPTHFLDEYFLRDLEELLSQYPYAIRQGLTLEILETTEWDDQDAAARVVRECKKLGLWVSLDDFGTGYSSLSYFRKLPLDEIKVDKSFVLDMLDEHGDQVIVESIISLSKQFGRRVVAEGIESEVVARRLAELGCDIGQGYHYSRPLPLGQALQWAESFTTGKEEAFTSSSSLSC